MPQNIKSKNISGGKGHDFRLVLTIIPRKKGEATYKLQCKYMEIFVNHQNIIEKNLNWGQINTNKEQHAKWADIMVTQCQKDINRIKRQKRKQLIRKDVKQLINMFYLEHKNQYKIGQMILVWSNTFQ
eukprot:60280_1